MKESVLVGNGREARLSRGPTESVELLQTRKPSNKLGRLDPVNRGSLARKIRRPTLSAGFGIVSYDDESGTYRMRAFNDGRFLETQVKLLKRARG